MYPKIAFDLSKLVHNSSSRADSKVNLSFRDTDHNVQQNYKALCFKQYVKYKWSAHVKEVTNLIPWVQWQALLCPAAIWANTAFVWAWAHCNFAPASWSGQFC